MSIFKYLDINHWSLVDNDKYLIYGSGVYQEVLGMALLVPFWKIFNRQIGHLGIMLRG